MTEVVFDFFTKAITDKWIVDRSFLVENIEYHGGVVANTPQRNSMHILLANRPLRTKRYLMALACGINIVSIMWLQRCIQESKLLDYNLYRLSNGYSLTVKHWVSVSMDPLPIFSRAKIYGFFILILVVDGESSSRDWTEIIQAAGAIISHSISESGLSFC
jgi:hypothetical protein